ncbi:MAG TPA: hypothetical protein VKA43_15280 [Gammaproteobacteria bacterium]|nr:hypothetical protein [Gammaproteobacteria bacterium]
MTPNLDQRIADLLNANAPRERDPMFRIQLLARREQKRFHRRTVLVLCATLALIAIVSSSYRSNASFAETASVVLLGLSLAGLMVYFPVVAHVLRRSRLKDV